MGDECLIPDNSHNYTHFFFKKYQEFLNIGRFKNTLSNESIYHQINNDVCFNKKKKIKPKKKKIKSQSVLTLITTDERMIEL